MTNEYKKINNYVLSAVLILSGINCNVNKYNDEILFKREIIKGKVVEKINIGRGDFKLVYVDSSGKDTLSILGHVSIYQNIDSFTVINKNKNSYTVYFQQLKKDNKRYFDTIYFIDHLPQSVKEN